MDLETKIIETMMRQNTFKWLVLSLFFLVGLASCKKEKMAKMKAGKYEMISIRTLPDGQKDTVHCMVYGPRVLEHHYYFSTEVDNKVLDKIDIGVNRRRMFVNGPFPKRVESMSIGFYSENFGSSMSFRGSVDSYDLQESKLTIMYTSNGKNYTTMLEEPVFTGSVQFNWIEP